MVPAKLRSLTLARLERFPRSMAAAVRRTVGGLVPLGPSMANAAVRLVSAAQRRRIAVLDVTPDVANVIDLGTLLKL
jgi:hypothetical protein